MEIATDIESTITLFNRANSQLQSPIFQPSHHYQIFIFTSNQREPAGHTHENLHQWRWPSATVTTAETHHPSPHCAHIHSVVFINIQQTSMNVNGCNSSHMEEFSSQPLPHALPCQTPFCQTAPLLPPVTWQQHVMGYWWEGSTSTAIAPTSASDIVGQHHQIGGITFTAALLLWWFWDDASCNMMLPGVTNFQEKRWRWALNVELDLCGERYEFVWVFWCHAPKCLKLHGETLVVCKSR